jgi:hypothetical protein
MAQKCTVCGKPSIPGLIAGCGKCQYHWNVGVFGKEWADKVRATAALLIVFALATFAGAQETPAKPHAFLDRTNLALFSADALVRSLDAESTRAFMTASCRCFKEEVLPVAIASSTPRMYAYSLGVAGAMVGAAYLAHRTGHHRLERLIPAGDAAFDSRYVVQNWRLTPPR